MLTVKTNKHILLQLKLYW